VCLTTANLNAVTASLSVPQNYQEQTQWCWAGVSQSILAYYGISQSQTNIAAYGTQGVNIWNWLWGHTEANDPNPGDPVRNGIDLILSYFAAIPTSTDGCSSQATLESKLIAGKPVVIRWGWDSGGGHFVIARGIDGNTVDLMDPWFGPTLNTYSWVVSGGGHTWTDSLYINGTTPAPATINRSPASMNFSGIQGGANPASQTLSILNTGGSALNWSVSDNAAWLSLSPTSGSSTGETDSVTVSVNTSGLTAGTYSATITIAASGATNTPVTTSVTLTVTDDAWDPTDDTASNGTQIISTTLSQSHGPHTLSNTDLADWFRVNMTAGYTYYFDTIGGMGDNYGELYSDSAGTNKVASDDDSGGNLQFSFNYTAATTQTYYLKIRAYTSGNTWSGSLDYSYVAPAPTITSIAPLSGFDNASVNITNLAGIGFLSGATVKLTKSGQPDINAINVAVVSASQITCTLPISGAAIGLWNVVVTNTDAQTAMLPNGFLITAPPLTPATPSGPASTITWRSATYFTSTTDPDGDQVKYGWDWNGDGTVDEWSELGSSGWTDSRPHSWSVAGTYNVKVKAQDSNGAESGWSTALSVTVATAPPVITSITPNSGYNYASVNITNLAGTGFLNGATVKLTKLGQPDINATNGTVVVVSTNQITCILPISGASTGAWNVMVINPDSQSGTLTNGFNVTVDLTAPVGVPSTPSAGALYSTAGDVTFTWGQGGASDPESGISGYDLQVGIDAASDASIFNGDAGNVFSKAFTGLAEGTYYTRVRAKNGYNLPGAYTPWSAVFKVDMTPPVPNPPVAGNNQVYITSITWTAAVPTDSLSGLNSQPYSFNDGAAWQAGASSTTAGLQPNSLYNKVIKYRDAAGNATAGLTVSTYTLAAVPAAFAAGDVSTASVSFSWDSNGNPSGTEYIAEIAGNIGFAVILGSSQTLNANAAFAGLQPDTIYYSRAKAVNYYGRATAYSASALALTLAAAPTGLYITGVSSGSAGLAWTANGNPASTLYRVARSLDNINFDISVTTRVVPTAVPALAVETTTYFKVRAENGSGVATDWDISVSTFVPDYTPPTGSPVTPSAGETFINVTTITFVWTAGTSLDLESGIAGYYLQIGTSAASNDAGVFSGDAGNVLSKEITGLTEGKTYYARVKAENGRGLYGSYSAWSDGITVDLTPPQTPDIISPTHPSTSTIYLAGNVTFTLSAQDAAGIAGYYCVIDYSPATVPPSTADRYIAGSSTGAVLADGLWFAHFAAKDLAGNIGQPGHYRLNIGGSVDPGQDNVVERDGTAVNLPAGTLSAAANVLISVPVTVPPQPRDSNLKDTGVYREIKLSPALTLQKSVTVSIPYTLAQLGGADEDSLKIAHYDNASSTWEIIYTSVVDKINRMVTASVNHFSLFKLVAYTLQSGELASVSNYPNPFTAGRGGTTKIHYSLRENRGVEIYIYDLLGRLVWHKSFQSGAVGGSIGVNDIAWDGKNDRGAYVGAGAYICVIKAGAEKKTIKIAVK